MSSEEDLIALHESILIIVVAGNATRRRTLKTKCRPANCAQRTWRRDLQNKHPLPNRLAGARHRPCQGEEVRVGASLVIWAVLPRDYSCAFVLKRFHEFHSASFMMFYNFLASLTPSRAHCVRKVILSQRRKQAKWCEVNHATMHWAHGTVLRHFLFCVLNPAGCALCLTPHPSHV